MAGPRGSSPSAHAPSQPVFANIPNTGSALPLAKTFVRPKTKILKRIPRASRGSAAKKLGGLLDAVVNNNNLVSWSRLLYFAQCCLKIPTRRRGSDSLASRVNNQIRSASLSPPSPTPPASRYKCKAPNARDPLEFLATRVSAKIEEGNLRGAVHLLCSEEVVADDSNETLASLQAKHPRPHKDSVIAPLAMRSDSAAELQIPVPGIAYAVRSFPCGSAGGPDGLTPQHLKDMIGAPAGEGAPVLLSALASFVQFVLSGEVLQEARPLFFGANLVPFRKPGGGVRPIAVGCTLRRLVAKCAGFLVREEMGELLAPSQLGYGVKRGAEAAVHAARHFVQGLEHDRVFVKLDFANAFNSLRRDKMLKAVENLVPDLLPFVHSAYCSTSLLFWRDKTLESAEGVQQGDPLGPLLFCLSIHHLISRLTSDFKLFYLDDGSLGGRCEDVLRDIRIVEKTAEELGLQLNRSKSEVVCHDSSTLEQFLSSSPGFCVTPPGSVMFLGSPLGDNVDNAILEKVGALKILESSIPYLRIQDALLLLRHCLAVPRFTYLLRTAPCFQSPQLLLFDEVLRRILSSVCNIPFSSDDQLWTQASLPVRLGGLGIRSAVHLAPSAFLASVAGSLELVDRIVPSYSKPLSSSCSEAALAQWSKWHAHAPLTEPASFSQREWDAPVVQEIADSLLASAPDNRSRARLLAGRCKETGAWLNAFPITPCGLRMDDESVRVAVGLRLGAPIGHPHQCSHCGADVDELATHGLSCRWSEGRLPRHAAVNEIICRSLTSAKVPSRLEPNGLYRSDGKRPDGISLLPWKNGKFLVWDVTCPDSFAPSHLVSSASGAGIVAKQAEHSKSLKYSTLQHKFHFAPVAIETSGVLGPEASTFLRDLGRRLKLVTSEPEAYNHLLQRVSVAVQRANCMAVLGSLNNNSKDLNCILF